MSRAYSEKISFITFFPLCANIFTNAPGLCVPCSNAFTCQREHSVPDALPLRGSDSAFQSATESRCFWWLRRRNFHVHRWCGLSLHTDWLSESAGSQLSPAVCKNLGAHWNIRHHWVQLVPISCSLARNVLLQSFVGPLWYCRSPLWSFAVLCASRVRLTHFQCVSRCHSAQWKSHAFSCSTKNNIFNVTSVLLLWWEMRVLTLVPCYPFSIRGVGNTDIVYVHASDW